MYKIYVLFSGGIDSTITCFILKKLGIKSIGVYIKVCIGDFNEIKSKELSNCISLSSFLKIKIKVINKTKEYKNTIYKKLIKEYSLGKTTNPDILCNKKIKFGTVLKKLVGKNKGIIITGHYARKNHNKIFLPKDKKKDQTYFIFNIKGIKHIHFIMGEFIKQEVIEIGKNIIPYKINKTSRGICFLGIMKFRNFISSFIKRETIIKTINGSYKIRSNNSYHLTIGQRVNICIGKKGYLIRKQKTKLIVTTNSNSPYLKKKTFRIKNLYIRGKGNNIELLLGKTSSQSTLEKCFLIKKRKNHKVVFLKPVGNISAGQYIVLYKNNICYGGGVVKQ
ncbi:aminomethyltransferase beta-barrel domain-containing protein [Candidatus Vidania fulgoroideorum]